MICVTNTYNIIHITFYYMNDFTKKSLSVVDTSVKLKIADNAMSVFGKKIRFCGRFVCTCNGHRFLLCHFVSWDI